MGLDVFVCSQPALGWAPVSHQWIKTDTKEAGMGPAKTNCGDAGNNSGDMPGDPVQVCDHSKRDKMDMGCDRVDNVDEQKVNDQLKFGRPLGTWGTNNNCQTFVESVLDNARVPSK